MDDTITVIRKPVKRRFPATDIGSRIKSLRKRLGLSQTAFGNLVGREYQTVSEWENNKTVPRASFLRRIAKRFEWPIEMFQQGGPMPADVVPVPSEVLGGDSSSEPAPLTAEDEVLEVAMLAQWMTKHWQDIAKQHELTGERLLDLLHQEAMWFHSNRYWKAYDSTITLIQQVRFLLEKRAGPPGGDAA